MDCVSNGDDSVPENSAASSPRGGFNLPKKRKQEDGPVKKFLLLHFDFGDEGNTCKRCSKKYSTTTSNSNLTYHLEHDHHIKQQNQKSTNLIPEYFRPLSASRIEKLTRSIATFLCEDMRPMSTVTGNGFKKMVKTFEPQFIVPHPTTFSRNWIPRLYNEKMEALFTLIKTVNSSTAITTDLWTDNFRRRSYITTTVHFINKWRLISFVVETSEFTKSKTGENLAHYLKSLTAKLLITDPVAVTDNGANVVKALEILKWRQNRCFAHTLNLIISDSLKLVPEVHLLLEKVRGCVSYFRFKYQNLEAKQKSILQSLQLDGEYEGFDEDEEIKIASTTLKRDVPTRWNSILIMLSSVYENYTTVKAVLFEENQIDMIFTTDELNLISQLISFLTDFKSATELLYGENYPSSSFVVPTVLKLKKSSLNDWLADAEEYATIKLAAASSKFATQVLKVVKVREGQNPKGNNNIMNKLKFLVGVGLDFRFLPFNEIQLLCTILDRRFLNLVKSNKFPADPLELLLKYYPSFTDASKIGAPAPKVREQENRLDSFLKDIMDPIDEPPLSDPAELEILEYLSNKPSQSYDLSNGLLDVWKKDDEIGRYPVLAKMALSFLAIPATSVPSERVFSNAGAIINQKRSNLDPELVDKLVFLYHNANVEIRND